MGKPTSTANDQASIIVSGTFTATGSSGNGTTGYGLGETGGVFGAAPSGGNPGQTVAPAFYHNFNVALWGTFVATVSLQRSFDGTNWNIVSSDNYGTSATYAAPVNLAAFEPEYGVIYRWNCSAYVSGTVNYRISQ